MAVSLYTVRIVLQTLSQEDYGIYSAVGGVILTFSVVSNVLTNASQRFFSFSLGENKGVNHVNTIFSAIFYTYIALSIVIIILAETLGVWFLANKMTIPIDRKIAAMWVFQCSLFSFIISLLTTPFQAMVIAKERMEVYAYISIIDVVLKLLSVFLLQYFEYDKLILYAVLLAFVHVLTNLIYIIYCISISKEARLVKTVDFGSFKSVFSYSSWTFFGALSGMCSTQGINISLNVFWGPLANAAYSISAQVSSVVTNFANNFALAIKPPLIKSYAAGKYDDVMILFNIGTRLTFMLMYMLILPIFIFTEEILTIWLGNVGPHMVDFVQLTLIYTIIVTMSNPITNIIQASGRVKSYHGIIDTFTLLSLPLIVISYKCGFSINTCYYITIAIFSIAHFIRLIILRNVFPLFSISRYVINTIVPMCLVVIATMLLMYYIKSMIEINLLNILMCCMCSILLVGLFSFVALFSRKEKLRVLEIIKNKSK